MTRRPKPRRLNVTKPREDDIERIAMVLAWDEVASAQKDHCRWKARRLIHQLDKVMR